MTIQVIIFSAATGRVRRVIDPQANAPNVITFLAQAKTVAGEGKMVYTKTGMDDLNAWQAAVTTQTGKTPANDRYVVVDANNNILCALMADPLCGDAVPGCTLIQHDIADSTWMFTPPSIFIAPITIGGPKPLVVG